MTRRYNPIRDTELDVGVVALVHSLQSARGKVLNGRRCILIEYLSNDERWKVQIQDESTTTALKVGNIKLTRRPVGATHPEYLEMSLWYTQQFSAMLAGRKLEKKYRNARGVTFEDDEPYCRARKFVELLDHCTDGYEPHQTIMHGEIARYYSVVPETSQSCDATMGNLEYTAGCIALSGMCYGRAMRAMDCGDGRPDIVVFALLESAPVSLSVLLSHVVSTHYIGPESGYDRVRDDYRSSRLKMNIDDCELTPDQCSKDYCNAMKGPLGILYSLHNLKNTPGRLDKILFGRIEKHPLFSKTLHRLFRLAARESKGTQDGEELGYTARCILMHMADMDGQMDDATFKSLTADRCSWDHGIQQQLLVKDDITSYEELLEFLQELLKKTSA